MKNINELILIFAVGPYHDLSRCEEREEAVENVSCKVTES